MAVAADPLSQGFADPPAAARPRVWWHWMNGNITAEGARLDLEWMKRIGIGGVQLFEGDLHTPQIVKQRLGYMSPPWRDALRTSVETADKLGLEFAIGTAPGWSATGGPWVKPADAMKKLVWSTLDVVGGKPFRAVLPHPPITTGPYQDVPLSEVDGGAATVQPSFYADSVVLAYPMAQTAPLPAPKVTASSAINEPSALRDGDLSKTIALKPAADGTASINYAYPAAIAVRSVFLGLPSQQGFGAPPVPTARLQASIDGVAYRDVAALDPTASPVRTASFPKITARFFRLLLSFSPGGGPPLAPGVAPFAPPPSPPIFQVAEFRLSSDPIVSRSAEKAGFATVSDYYAADGGTTADIGPAPRTVIDLTGRMHPDGTLDWTPPAGRWRILRLGMTLTGHQNAPAPVEATGLEVDKLDPDRVGAYLDTYLGLYRSAVGDRLLGAQGIRAML